MNVYILKHPDYFSLIIFYYLLVNAALPHQVKFAPL
jgi:hypothetical protein